MKNIFLALLVGAAFMPAAQAQHYFQLNGTTSPSVAQYETSTGFIGIGQTTPTGNLSIYTRNTSTSTPATGLDIFNERNDFTGLSYTPYSFKISRKQTLFGGTASAVDLCVSSGGGVGINNANPLFSLDVNGTSNFNGQMTGTNSAFSGIVKIGSVTTPAGYTLYVEKGILTEKVKVALKSSADWSDFVFDPSYKLSSLGDVESYIAANKHLPGLPSAEEVACDGIDVAKMDATLLQKIEELTLYTIKLQKEVDMLKSQK